jgi:hypothetical protein
MCLRMSKRILGALAKMAIACLSFLCWTQGAGFVYSATLNQSPPSATTRLVFIHHSTGQNWLNDALRSSLNSNNYYVVETDYGWGPDAIGDRTDIGHWYDWFSGPSRDTYTAALYSDSYRGSLNSVASDPGGLNRVVMFKSCFPNSALGGNPNDAPTAGNNPLRGNDVSSSYHTVANAKGIYVDLLTYFASRQDTLFIVITAPPLVSDATNPTQAANARALNEWLTKVWLAAYPYHNVTVFDFYTVLTSNGGNSTTNDLGSLSGNHHRLSNGEIEHISNQGSNYSMYGSSSGDSHPTPAGNQKAAGEFVPFLNVALHCWKGDGDCPSNNSPGNQTLTVIKSGTGTGTVTSSPAGINCGASCIAGFAYNQVVTLSASATSGSTFAGWSGEGCSGTGTCQVTMSQARNVNANFGLSPCTYSLNPTSKNFGPELGSAGLAIAASPSSCGWSASTDSSWIRIASGGSGTGNGTLYYTVEPNTGTSRRQGTINVQDQTHTVIQAPRSAAFVTLNIPSGGTARVSTPSVNSSTHSGYAKVVVNSGSAPYGTAVFSFRQNGVTVAEAGVPASPPTSSARIFIDYRSRVTAVPGRIDSGLIDINTGIAIVNNGTIPANVIYILRDSNGNILTTGNGTILAGHHIAKFIDQFREVASDFNLPANFRSSVQFGCLDIVSDQLISVVALRGTNNQENEFLFTTTPVADLTQDPSWDQQFPQFADGGGYSTSLILLNTRNETERGQLNLYDDEGHPLAVQTVDGKSGSAFEYSIPPNGAFRFQTDGSPSETRKGWVDLQPDAGSSGAPVGSGVFSYNPNNKLVSESGIPSANSTTHARVYVDLTQNHNTGLAIANLEHADATMVIRAFEADGITLAVPGQSVIGLPGNGHTAKFADQFIAGLPADFTGVLDISSTTPFAALTVRSLMNERNEFLMTTFPIADLNQPAPSPIVFPQVADGDGYVTEFILISSGQAASATVFYYDERGAPTDFSDPN